MMAGACIGLFVIVVMIGFSLMQSPELESELDSDAVDTRLIDASRELRELAAKVRKESKRG